MAKPRQILPRIALILAFLVGTIGLKILGAKLAQRLGVPPLYRELVSGSLALAALVLAGIIVDRSWPSFRDQRFRLWLTPLGGRDGLLGGVGIGVLMVVAAWGTMWLLGGVHVSLKARSLSSWLGLTGYLVIATLINAAWEEYVFRGWPFAAAAKMLPASLVVLLIGALFGLAHYLSPHPSWAAILSTSFAGWMLGFALLASGGIALPLGIHTGWNLTKSLLTTKLFWNVRWHPETWRSGGTWGFEASVPAIAVTALAAALFAWRALKKS